MFGVGGALLEVSGLGKSYGGRLAVDGLDFTVAAGEVLGLVGPNGAGKTTTMRCIAGIIPPTTGVVRIAGHDIQREPLAAKRRLGFIPDEPQLFDLLTVDEHIAFTARIYEVDQVAARRDALFSRLELTGRGQDLPGALSRGMRQKVAVACGLLPEPRVILFDEPLTGLDPVAIRAIKALMRERADAGAAVVVSSHLLSLVEEIADSLLVLKEGRRLFHGTLGEMRAELAPGESLEDGFLRMTG
ncbi:MAG: ABC transporter ATP-binding protein [Deltaproteobacteria bacterium]|nr:MAG: ABC transporter ATP-binding protein [Deltaproteobacteria bacterium]